MIFYIENKCPDGVDYLPDDYKKDQSIEIG